VVGVDLTVLVIFQRGAIPLLCLDWGEVCWSNTPVMPVEGGIDWGEVCWRNTPVMPVEGGIVWG